MCGRERERERERKSARARASVCVYRRVLTNFSQGLGDEFLLRLARINQLFFPQEVAPRYNTLLVQLMVNIPRQLGAIFV